MEQHSTSKIKRTAKEVLNKAKELQKKSMILFPILAALRYLSAPAYNQNILNNVQY